VVFERISKHDGPAPTGRLRASTRLPWFHPKKPERSAMKKFAVLLFLGLLGVSGTVLHSSNMSFKDADAACAGTLGSVTFAMGHTRAHAAPGVDLTERSTSHGMATMTFSDKAKGKMATVMVNGHTRSVSGKHVTVKMNRTVACVKAD
jgi:hypothetical protein